MKATKIAAAVIVLIFSMLGLAKVVPFTLSVPIMLTALALLNLLNCRDAYQAGKKTEGLLLLLASLFVAIVVIYTVFF